MSVIDFMDKLLVWDTGSSDNTVEIIQELIKKYPQKIDFLEVGKVDKESFTKLRQQMLEQTKSDWVLILDGDEIWWKKSIQDLVQTIRQKGKDLDSIVSPYINALGDIYHYQSQDAGKYNIDQFSGHITIRAFSKDISGVHFDSPYGSEGMFDKNGVPIQNRDRDRRIFVDAPFFHCTHLIRSSSLENDKYVMQRSKKYKYEIGGKFAQDFKYPEVFYFKKPDIVPDIWNKVSWSYFVRSYPQTAIKKIKRKLMG